MVNLSKNKDKKSVLFDKYVYLKTVGFIQIPMKITIFGDNEIQ